MESENRKLGELAAQHATDVILVGKQTAPIKDGLARRRISRLTTCRRSTRWRSRCSGIRATSQRAIRCCSSTTCLTLIRRELRIECMTYQRWVEE